MNIVIVGAGYAGVLCAIRVARKTRGSASITLVSATDRFVERIRLHEESAGGGPRDRALAPLLRGTGVNIHIGRAERIDLDQRTVLAGGDPIPFDRLVLALGSHTNADLVPGIREHALTVDRADCIAARVGELSSGSRVVVIGGGLTGIEAATELAERNPSLRVALLSRAPLMGTWSRAARAHVLSAMERLHIELREGVEVRSVEPDRVETDGAPQPFDMCVWTAGFSVSDLPARSGLAVDRNGRVLLDSMLRSISHPHVYVAGDLGTTVEPPGDPLDMGCKSAMPMGAHVADNLVRAMRDQDERPFDWGMPFYCVSLGRQDGLIQMPKGSSHTGAILKGRTGAWMKETICRFTVWALHLERRGIGYVWLHTGRVPASNARLLRA